MYRKKSSIFIRFTTKNTYKYMLDVAILVEKHPYKLDSHNNHEQ